MLGFCQQGGAWDRQLHSVVRLQGCQPAQRPLLPVAVSMRCVVHLKEGKRTGLCPSSPLSLSSCALAFESAVSLLSGAHHSG